MMAAEPGRWGIYVHVPTCRVRCPYCAFNVIPLSKMDNWGRFFHKVNAEYQIRKPRFRNNAATVYFGGGTPSLAPVEQIGSLLDAFDLEVDAEISLEANPEDVTPEWIEQIQNIGVNRISLGVQSTNAELLRTLGRAHTRKHLEDAIAALQTSGLRSWSVDLMFSLPNQSLSQVRTDVLEILAYSPPHLSLYGLTIEEGTAFHRASQEGKLASGSEEEWRSMYDYIVATLQNNGFERYEISNFARSGHRSKHNQLYWQDRPYMGLGPGAHGYEPNGSRWSNYRNLDRYLTKQDPSEEVEQPDAGQAAIDYLLSAIRSIEGVNRTVLQRKTGLWPDESLIDSLVERGLVICDNRSLKLTIESFPIADSIVKILIDGLQKHPGELD